MGGFDVKAAARRIACVIVLAAATADLALGQPVTLRLGYGTAAEEPLWVVVAKPDLAKNYGKAYALDATRFTGSDKRSQAFEAGAIDLAASSANGVIFAAAEAWRPRSSHRFPAKARAVSARASTSSRTRRSNR